MIPIRLFILMMQNLIFPISDFFVFDPSRSCNYPWIYELCLSSRNPKKMLFLPSLQLFQTVIRYFHLSRFFLISASEWYFYQFLKDILKYRKTVVRMENETVTTAALFELTKLFQNYWIQIIKPNIQVKVWDFYRKYYCFFQIWKRYWIVLLPHSSRYEQTCSKHLSYPGRK